LALSTLRFCSFLIPIDYSENIVIALSVLFLFRLLMREIKKKSHHHRISKQRILATPSIWKWNTSNPFNRLFTLVVTCYQAIFAFPILVFYFFTQK
jgi:hypothetical protein